MNRKLISLFFKLVNIQKAIDAESRDKRPDWMRLFRLKRLRLRIKDRLYQLASPAPTLAYARIDNRRGVTRLQPWRHRGTY